MTERDLIQEIADLDADTVYFMRRGDGEMWGCHVRHPGAGPSLYAVAEGATLKEAVLALLDGEPEDEDWQDLI